MSRGASPAGCSPPSQRLAWQRVDRCGPGGFAAGAVAGRRPLRELGVGCVPQDVEKSRARRVRHRRRGGIFGGITNNASKRIIPLKSIICEFRSAKTTEAYMERLREHLVAHGRPLALYSDRYSVFRVNRKGGSNRLRVFHHLPTGAFPVRVIAPGIKIGDNATWIVRQRRSSGLLQPEKGDISTLRLHVALHRCVKAPSSICSHACERP